MPRTQSHTNHSLTNACLQLPMTVPSGTCQKDSTTRTKWLKQRTEIVGVIKTCAQLFPTRILCYWVFHFLFIHHPLFSPPPILFCPFVSAFLVSFCIWIFKARKTSSRSRMHKQDKRKTEWLQKDVFSILRRCLTIPTSTRALWSFVGHRSNENENQKIVFNRIGAGSILLRLFVILSALESLSFASEECFF